MKKDDRDMLIALGTLGAVILAGGVGMAVLCAHEGDSIGRTIVSFASGSVITALALCAGFTMDI